jgi:hypothetical protein
MPALGRSLQLESSKSVSEIRTSLQQDLVTLRNEAVDSSLPLFEQRKRQEVRSGRYAMTCRLSDVVIADPGETSEANQCDR